MRIVIDTAKGTLVRDDSIFSLYTKEAFEIISEQWLRVGWNQKYSYSFSWMGRPVIQLPQDLLRIQEVIYQLKPDVIIETGVAHGGSLVFYATLCKAMGKGRAIGIDIEIRKHNREAIKAHELSSLITLIEGSSIASGVINQVKSLVNAGETAIVILDSDHSRKHVLAELEAYHELVTVGSFILATDGVVKTLHDVPRGKAQWVFDNPDEAITEFLSEHSGFVREQPTPPFRDNELTEDVTHWPGAWLKRIC